MKQVITIIGCAVIIIAIATACVMIESWSYNDGVCRDCGGNLVYQGEHIDYVWRYSNHHLRRYKNTTYTYICNGCGREFEFNVYFEN